MEPIQTITTVIRYGIVVITDHLETVRTLIGLGANCNNPETLRVARRFNYVRIEELLIDSGANLEALSEEELWYTWSVVDNDPYSLRNDIRYMLLTIGGVLLAGTTVKWLLKWK